MADAIIGVTVKVLLEKTLSLIAIDRIGLVFGFQQDLEILKESAEMIQAVLADAEDKQTDSRALQLWLKRLEGLAFDAYYVLDELNYEFLRRKVKSRNQLKGKVSSFFSFSKDEISFRWRMASKVRDINIKLKKINQEATDFGLSKGSPPLLPAIIGVTACRQTDSTAAPYVVGRDSDESKIVEMLLGYPEKPVSVIPIVGMGGLGKTTLAKSVYNNQQIDGHFSKKIWICVSENFEVMELFKLILGSLWRNKVEMLSRDDVVQQIRKELDGKRYLLVLDDVWNEIPDLWDTFYDSLVGLSTATGSKCLITTRLQTVASIVSRDPPYELGKLSDDDCWCIIKQKVIGSGETPEELSGIRTQIIKKSNGLPLAANVIGGLLGRQRKEDWQSTVEKRLLNINGDHESSIMQILKLSFDYLPSPSIKKCFAYWSIFDKDKEMKRDILIELWMAEGFLQPNLQNETMMEEIGANYVNTLLQSSLLEEIKDASGRRCYKMHDLVHDLAQSISKLQRLNSENDVINNSYQVRSLAIARSGEIIKVEATSHSASILNSNSMCKEMLWKFKHLHTLNLSNADITELPSSIGKLKHLRFLSVPDNIKSLPESICKLFNLQTLRINFLKTLRMNLQTWRMGRIKSPYALPQGMSNLISLRHLYFFAFDAKFEMPVKMGRLNCLQTLEFFNVGQKNGCRIEELESLKDLKGALAIRNLELVKDKEEASRANLSGKQNLIGLVFCWRSEASEEGVEIHDEQVLEGLKPHPNLKALKIENFMGDRFPQWLVNLWKLETLKLIGCGKCSELPVLGHLPCLKTLELKMENVSCIGVSFYGLDVWRGGGGGGGSGSNSSGVQVPLSSKKLFPALQILKLISMRSLSEWKEAEVDDDVALFPLLEHLNIYDCSKLTIAPSHFPSLKRLSIYGNVQVSAVKSILSIVSTTLTSLYLRGVVGLTCLSDVLGSCCTSLRELTLGNCPNLMALPEYLFQLQSLRHLDIDKCPKIVHIGPPPPRATNNCLSSLDRFNVTNCEGLISIAAEILEGCTSLDFLDVEGCPNLVSFPHNFLQTPNVSTISFQCCPKLFTEKNNMPRGFGHLTNLEEIRIGPFLEDDCSIELFDWTGLMACSSSLRSLSLCGLTDMESLLPDRFQLFTSLKYLRINEFGLLEGLPDWLGNIESLEELAVYHCEKLRYLPSVPAMRRLTKLRELEFYSCPLLEERCSPESGPDSEWSKISQLPNIKIRF